MFENPLTQNQKDALLAGVPERGPLAIEDIRTLLERASAERHPQGRALIQCRLVQAAHDGVYPTDGPLSDALGKLESVYVAGLRSGNLPDKTNEIAELIAGAAALKR